MATQTPINKLNAVIKTSQGANTLNFEQATLLLEGSIIFQEKEDQFKGAWAAAKVQKSQVTLTGRLASPRIFENSTENFRLQPWKKKFPKLLRQPSVFCNFFSAFC